MFHLSLGWELSLCRTTWTTTTGWSPVLSSAVGLSGSWWRCWKNIFNWLRRIDDWLQKWAQNQEGNFTGKGNMNKKELFHFSTRWLGVWYVTRLGLGGIWGGTGSNVLSGEFGIYIWREGWGETKYSMDQLLRMNILSRFWDLFTHFKVIFYG